MGKGIQILTVLLLLLGIGVAATYLGTQYGLIKGSSIGLPSAGSGTNIVGGCAAGYAAPNGFTCVSLPLKAFVFDIMAPAGTTNPIASATVSILDPTTLSGLTPSTTGSDGTTTTTGNNFNSGQSKICKVTATSYTSEWLPCFVSPIASGATTSATAINMPLPMVYTNTFSWSASGGGTSWGSSFSSYNFANTGLTSYSTTFTITPNTNNRGYYSGYDYQNKVQNLAIVEFKSASSPGTSISGCQFSTTRNNVYYCQFILSDGYTTINPSYQQGSSAILNNYPKDQTGSYTSILPVSQSITLGGFSTTGSLSIAQQGTNLYPNNQGVQFSATFKPGSLASGSSENWTMTVFLNADVLYFDGGSGYAQNGSYGGDQSTATLTGGNTPTITLRN